MNKKNLAIIVGSFTNKNKWLDCLYICPQSNLKVHGVKSFFMVLIKRMHVIGD